MSQNTTGHTRGPWVAERLRLDGHEWFVKSECRNLPPYDWMPRFSAKIDALKPLSGGYVESRSGRAGRDEGCCSLAITENAANARIIAAAPDLLKAAVAARDSAGWFSMSEAEQRIILDALSKAEAR